jgi:hypothetical protein
MSPCAFGEVVRFDQQHAEAARYGVERHAHADAAAADHRQVPLAVFLQAFQQRGAGMGGAHGGLP